MLISLCFTSFYHQIFSKNVIMPISGNTGKCLSQNNAVSIESIEYLNFKFHIQTENEIMPQMEFFHNFSFEFRISVKTSQL